MKIKKLMFSITAIIFLFSTVVIAQETATKKDTPPKTNVITKSQEKNTKSVGKTQKTKSKKPSRSKSRRPKDVPEVPLVNSKITYDHSEFDFGVISHGSRVSHNFPVSNTGRDTLNITKIRPT